MKNVAVVEKLSKDYPVLAEKRLFGLIKKFTPFRALDGFSFELKKGEFLGLIGPNGSGKTTLMKMLGGVLTPTSGKAEVLGYTPWDRKRDYLKQIGVLFGNRSNLFFDVPVRDSLELYKEMYGLDKKEYEERLAFFTELLGLEDIIDSPVRKLSFGQRMRAEMASVFLHKPKFVILDEPTIGMDVVVKEKVYSFLKEINKRDGVSVVFTTHIMGDIEELCKRVIVLHKGKKIWDGKTDKLKAEYVKTKRVTIEFSEEKKGSKMFLKKWEAEKKGNAIVATVEKGREMEMVDEAGRVFNIVSFSVQEADLERVIRNIYGGSQ
ncbi:MAG: ATP-binding cassette domain-containing protein [Methanobacteriota archaeon]|nr:MAG: ATP-binding cassette domain-containing protein [Euryarchaeota archaeon]